NLALLSANLALLSKWGWKYKTDNGSLWCKVIKAIHHSTRKHEFLPVRKSISGYWKPIASTVLNLSAEGMDFVANIRGVVGVGDTISFWQDPWLLSGALKDHYPALYSIEKKKSATVQQRLQNLNNSRTPKWQWNKNTLTLEETSLSDQLSYLIT
ncbi:hypothetical protein SSX86_033233, partial [Deinandra increscens subsp. villosa]